MSVPILRGIRSGHNLRSGHSLKVGVLVSMKKGLERFIHRELTFLESEGLEIKLFPMKQGPGLYNPERAWKVHRWRPAVVLLMQPGYFLRSPVRYLRLLREAIATMALVDFAIAWHLSAKMADVDVIYATFGDHKLFVGYFCKRILGKPLAVTIHAYELYRNPNLKMFLRALSAADQIITVTEHNREYLAARYRVDPSTVEVVRCGVDTDEYRPERKFTILIVGFFAERKGHEVLFRALRALDDPGIEVWVVGDAGAERPVDVKEAAARLGVESQIAFFGKLGANALSALYRACDVFCLPCHFDSSGVGEGFPVAIIEAMAFGKPVITTRHVEVPRVVPEILVDENDAEGLAAAIRKVQGSLPLRQRLGAQNRQLAEDVFSSGNARKTARILRNLATSPSSAHRRDEGGIVGTAAASV